MQPCIACIWKAGADEPSHVLVSLDRELALDRELFGVTDMSISRAANAPRLNSINSRRVRLTIPAQCATGAVVVQRMDWSSLQRRVSSGRPDYPRLRAAELGRHSLVARGENSALALLRSASPDAERPDQLVALPVTRRLQGPVDVELDAPSIVIVGPCAVAILPGITLLPDSGDNISSQCQRFRLPALDAIDIAAHDLSTVEREVDERVVRIAGCDEALPIGDLPNVAKTLLHRLRRSSWFVPALVEDRFQRLCLLYERRDGSAGAIVSPAELEPWLLQIAQTLPGSRLAAPPSKDASGTYKVISCASSPSSAPLARTLTTTALPSPTRLGQLETRHAGFAADLEHLKPALDTGLGILLLGESGTGKEHLAHEIHAQSKRAAGPFVAINLAALPEPLIETELFGHVRGAYTGTQGARNGAFVTASGGTLLLDEIGDAPLRVQLALLRVLESRSVRPVGADREHPVDVRVIAATSRDLQKLIREERFREDLFYRIVGVPVTLPPLRKRACDIPQLASAILHCLGCKLTLSDEALAQLQSQRWSGNIRALRSTLQHAALLAAESNQIEPKHLRYTPELERTPSTLAAPLEFPELVRGAGEELWREHTLPALGVSEYERRALHRAALLYLALRHGKREFPAALSCQWALLFGPRWATSEKQRGLRELLRQLGASPRDETVRSWVLELVEVGRQARSG